MAVNVAFKGTTETFEYQGELRGHLGVLLDVADGQMGPEF